MNRRRSVGVPPASSPSVSFDEGPGGETPPELAAGTAALRHAGSRPLGAVRRSIASGVSGLVS